MACHIGAFGPQLTPYGRQFKIGGYVQDGGEGWAAHVPLAGYAQTSFTHTDSGQPSGPAPRFNSNNNVAIDQISLFLAGRLNDHVGAFVQGTYSEINRGFRLDNADVRLTNTFDTKGGDIIAGFDINNSPTVQDAYNSTYAWGYPYIASSLAPVPAAAPLLAGGLSGNTIGLTGYLWYDRRLYFEAGGYGTYGPTLLTITGSAYGPGSTQSIAPYARVAYEWNWNGQSAQLGASLLQASFNPRTSDRTASGEFGHDSYIDFSIDGGYQFLGDQTNIAAIYGIFTHEDQDLRGSFATNRAAGSRHRLNLVHANVSYFYQQSYGLTVGISNVSGNSDPVLYAPAPISGSANGKPNSNAFIVEADWIPFGKDGSWGAPFANLKLGAQYTAYTQFNGGGKNYDGFGRSASGNNSIYLFSWLAW